VHQPPHTGGSTGGDHVLGATHIDRLDLQGRRGNAVQRGHVHEGVAASHRSLERHAVANVHPFKANLTACAPERANEMATDESAPPPVTKTRMRRLSSDRDA
jgi:hypothetical protein